MSVRQIPEDAWADFLAAFSGAHRGGEVTIAVYRNHQERVVCDHAHLHAVRSKAGPPTRGGIQILLEAERAAAPEANGHPLEVDRALEVRLETTPDGRDASLVVASLDGSITTVHLTH